MNFPLISHIKPPYSDPNFDSSYLPLSLLALLLSGQTSDLSQSSWLA